MTDRTKKYASDLAGAILHEISLGPAQALSRLTYFEREVCFIQAEDALEGYEAAPADEPEEAEVSVNSVISASNSNSNSKTKRRAQSVSKFTTHNHPDLTAAAETLRDLARTIKAAPSHHPKEWETNLRNVAALLGHYARVAPHIREKLVLRTSASMHANTFHGSSS